MNRPPGLKGRYDTKLLSPLQRGLLAVIGFSFLMASQVDALLDTAFRVEVFDHEILRVEPVRRPASRRVAPGEPRILFVSPLDWPRPPVPTAWSPSPQPRVDAEEPSSLSQIR